MEVSVFMAERLGAQLEKMAAQLEAQRQAHEAQLQEYEAKLVTQRQEHEAKNCVSDAQLERLQERFGALHEAELLSDAELFALEDKVVDFIEWRSSVPMTSGGISTAVESVRKLVGICETVSKDAMLARQLRRKFL